MARPATIRLTYRGKTRLLKEWSLRTHLGEHLIRRRLELGWSVERTLETKKRRYGDG